MSTDPEYEARWRRYLAEHPDDANGHAALAPHLGKLGNLPEAIAEAQRAIALGSGLALPHYVLARIAGLARADEAIRHIHKAIELEPDWVYGYSLLAHLELNHPRAALDPAHRTAALRAAEAGLRVQPDDPGCLSLLAIALGQLGRFEEAEAALMKALAVAPDSSYVHSRHGQYRLSRGNLAPALASFKKASQLDPSSHYDRWWARRLGPLVRLLTGFTWLSSRFGLLRITRSGDSGQTARWTAMPGWPAGLVCIVWAMASLRVLLDFVGDSAPLWICIPAGTAAPLGIVALSRLKGPLRLPLALLLILILVGWIELPLLMLISPDNISEVARQAWPRVNALPEFHLTRLVGIASLLGSGLFLACLGLAKAIERALGDGTALGPEDRRAGTRIRL
jgi:Flp pilus assembly protein TadD